MERFKLWMVCGISSSLGLIVAMMLTAICIVDNIDPLALLSALGAAAGGAGGVIAAIAAYKGVNAWAHQIRYKKHIAIVWECVDKLGEFDSAFSKMELEVFRNRSNAKSRSLNYSQTIGSLKEPVVVVHELIDPLASKFSNIDRFINEESVSYENFIAVDLKNTFGDYTSISLMVAPDLDLAEKSLAIKGIVCSGQVN